MSAMIFANARLLCTTTVPFARASHDSHVRVCHAFVTLMSILWALLLLVIVLAAMAYVRKYRRAGTSFFWPWLDPDRRDPQLRYIAEEEIKRLSEEAPERDLAP